MLRSLIALGGLAAFMAALYLVTSGGPPSRRTDSRKSDGSAEPPALPSLHLPGSGPLTTAQNLFPPAPPKPTPPVAPVRARATCKPGDTEKTPSVTHAWASVGSGEDRRGPADGWPRGRIRWYTSFRCGQCGASRLSLTEWDEP